MTDEKLLELAAKAAGYRMSKIYDMIWDDDVAEYVDWKPLTDDGDALRLAVELSLPIEFREPGFGYDNTPENRRVMCGKYWDSNESRYCMFAELHGIDKQAATRRAIVRAAAEIGKTI